MQLDAERGEGSCNVRRKSIIGDDPMNAIETANATEGDASELGMVSDEYHLTRMLDHDALGLRLHQVRRREPLFDVDAIRTEKQLVYMDCRDRLLGERTNVREDAPSDLAADDYQFELTRRKLPRDIQRVGDDGDSL